jgi:hypothetical protein
VGLVDSITHPWRELCDSYLNQVNEFRRKKGWSSQKKLEFQDWGPIKARFAEWSDFYLNSPMHLVIAGRAGDMFEHQEREDDPGKKDLVKTGVKMLTEKEFGFEPSLLVMMEGEQLEIRGKRIITRRATVLGDRFTVLDGHQVDFGSFDKKGVNVGHEAACKAVGDFFQAHLDCYMANAHVPVDTETKTDFAMDESGDDNWTAEKRRRTIYLEEIQGEITRRYPGQTAAEKKKKLELLELIFATRSWTKIEGMASNDLRECLRELRAHLQPKGLPPAADEDAPDPDMPDPDTLLASNPADG